MSAALMSRIVSHQKMKLSSPQEYELELLDSETYKVKGKNGEEKFSAPASSKAIPKLYVVHDSEVIHYVGITRQSIATRLRYGLKAKGTHGYYGYKWKKHSEKLELSIWVLENMEPDEAYQELETIEAEIIFLCRLHFDQWPESQHEIHFHKSGELHRKCAQRIYEQIESNING